MTIRHVTWQPRYTISSVIARHLMEIETAPADTLSASYRRASRIGDTLKKA